MRIVVCTDFSEESLQVFAPAASLARQFGADLLVVHQAASPTLVVSDLAGPLPGPTLGGQEAHREQLQDLVSSQACFDGLSVETGIVAPGGLDLFNHFLTDRHVDLVILATHGRTGIKRFLLGSFAERVLSAAPCSVLVYRSPKGRHKSEDFLPRKILVPHDLLPTSSVSLAAACSWARRFEASLRLLFVIEHDPGVLGCFADVVHGSMEERQRIRKEATARLQTLVNESCQGIEARLDVVVGKPVQKIVEQAGKYGAHLIVMAPHAKSKLDHFVLGSVAEGTARYAACSVLLVR